MILFLNFVTVAFRRSFQSIYSEKVCGFARFVVRRCAFVVSLLYPRDRIITVVIKVVVRLCSVVEYEYIDKNDVNRHDFEKGRKT